MTTSGSRPTKRTSRAATPAPAPAEKPAINETAGTAEQIVMFERPSKDGSWSVYQGVSRPGQRAAARLVYLSSALVQDFGNPARFKITIEPLDD